MNITLNPSDEQFIVSNSIAKDILASGTGILVFGIEEGMNNRLEVYFSTNNIPLALYKLGDFDTILQSIEEVLREKKRLNPGRVFMLRRYTAEDETDEQ